MKGGVGREGNEEERRKENRWKSKITDFLNVMKCGCSKDSFGN